MRFGGTSYGGGDFARQNTPRDGFGRRRKRERVKGIKGGMLLAPFTR
jgi:hypothetical protein